MTETCCCDVDHGSTKNGSNKNVSNKNVSNKNSKLTLNVRASGCRCGGNVDLKKSLFETVTSYPECKCLQIFLGDPTTYNCTCISHDDKQKTLKYCTDTNTSLYVHCPFVANLAKPDSSRAINVLSKELDIVSNLPAACVLHVGKVGTIENVAQHINQIDRAGYLKRSSHDKVPFHLLLEIAAGQGTELGRSWEDMRHLYEALDYTKIGLCIDTQHAFASGMNSFQTHEDIVKLFDSANSIATKGISMIHLNDSSKPFNSHVDRHAPLKQGHIWYHNDQGLKSLLKISKECGIDLISETSDPFGDNLIVKQYMNQF